jgi:hypothetical protein
MTFLRALRILAWVLLIGLAFVTIAPIEFRPVTPLPVQLERALALAVIGFVFAIAYPRHVVLVTIVVLGSTALFEALQVLEPSRHGRMVDLAVKIVGGGAGIVVGQIVSMVRAKRLE